MSERETPFGSDIEASQAKTIDALRKKAKELIQFLFEKDEKIRSLTAELIEEKQKNLRVPLVYPSQISGPRGTW